MADVDSTPNDYSKHRHQVTRNSEGFVFTPAVDTETAQLKWALDSVDIFTPTSTQEYPLGSKLERGGEMWRYCKNGAGTLAIGAPIQARARVHAEQDDDIVVSEAAAIGATAIRLTSTANLDGSPNDEANNFAGGFAIVNDAAGEGQCVMIKSNGALGTTATVQFQLYDKLTIALTTSSQCGLIGCPYNGVIATAAPLTGKLIGVPQMAVTASYYFWCKTRGPAAVVANAAVAFGTMVVAGITAALADPRTASTNLGTPLGQALTIGVATGESFIVDLALDA